MGKIEKQMIQIRDSKNNKSNNTTNKSLIEELTTDNKSLPETRITDTASPIKCTYQIIIDPESSAVKNLKPKYLTVSAFIEKPVSFITINMVFNFILFDVLNRKKRLVAIH